MSGGKPAETKASPIERAVSTNLKQNLFPAATDLFNTGTANMYTGSRYAGPSGLTMQNRKLTSEYLLPQLTNTGRQMAGTLGSLQNLQGLGSYQGAMDKTLWNEAVAGRLRTNDYITQLSDKAGAEFRRSILPAISDQAMAAGQYGGAAQQDVAEGVAAADFGADLTRQISEALFADAQRNDLLRDSALNRGMNQYTTDRQLALQAAGYMPSAQQALSMPFDIRGQMGAQMGVENQYGLDDRIMQFENPRELELRRLRDYAGLLGFSDSRGYTQQQTAGKPNMLAGIAGGAMSGYQMSGGNPYGALIGAGVGLLGSR